MPKILCSLLARARAMRLPAAGRSTGAFRARFVPALAAGLLLLASLGTAGYGPAMVDESHSPPLYLYPDQIAALRSLAKPPEIGAHAALVTDLDAGEVLYSYHAKDPLAPASTAKLMTALLVLQNTRPTDVVTVSANAAATEGSRMGLTEGEQLTVHDMMYGLLMPSGNDAAVALAEHVSGSVDAFVQLMNQTAATMGLAQTHFANPDGLDADGQVSSATDLTSLAVADLRYPLFAQIVRTAHAQVAGEELDSTNQLLGVYPGADGVKTGTTDAAGQCLVASISRNGHRLIAVVMDSPDRYADAKALLDYATAGWAWRTLALPDDALAWADGPDGELHRLTTSGSEDVFLPTWEWQVVRYVRVIDPTAPMTGARPIGTLRLVFDGGVIAVAPLTVMPGP